MQAKCKAGHGQPAHAVIAACTTSGDYSLSGCKAKGGRCPHGRLIAIAKRKGENHCGECDEGYRLVGTECEPWGGRCQHGTCAPWAAAEPAGGGCVASE